MSFFSTHVKNIWSDMEDLKIIMACDAIDFLEKYCNTNTKKFKNPRRLILCEKKFREQKGKECKCCHFSPAIFKNDKCARNALFKYIFNRHNTERLYDHLNEEDIKIVANLMIQEYVMVGRV